MTESTITEEAYCDDACMLVKERKDNMALFYVAEVFMVFAYIYLRKVFKW